MFQATIQSHFYLHTLPPPQRHIDICSTNLSMSMSISVKVLTHNGKTVSISSHRVKRFPCHKPSNMFSSHRWIIRPADADMHCVSNLVGGSADSRETQVFYVTEKSLGWRERKTNKMQLIWCLLSNFYLNMFQASLCPSSGEQDRVLLHMVFCTGCAGCGCVELGRKLCALCESYCSTQTVTFTQIATQLHTTTASTTSAEHICSSTWSCSPDDGHNDAWNMLR